jgi:hypothetical protein
MFSSSTAIDQKDIQEVQNDFCKSLMWEVLSEKGYFYDYTSEYMSQIPSLRLFALEPNNPSIHCCDEA